MSADSSICLAKLSISRWLLRLKFWLETGKLTFGTFHRFCKLLARGGGQSYHKNETISLICRLLATLCTKILSKESRQKFRCLPINISLKQIAKAFTQGCWIPDASLDCQ